MSIEGNLFGKIKSGVENQMSEGKRERKRYENDTVNISDEDVCSNKSS